MIEGPQSSLSDLLLFEFEHQPGVLLPPENVQECMGKLELFLRDQPERRGAALGSLFCAVRGWGFQAAAGLGLGSGFFA